MQSVGISEGEGGTDIGNHCHDMCGQMEYKYISETQYFSRVKLFMGAAFVSQVLELAVFCTGVPRGASCCTGMQGAVHCTYCMREHTCT